MLQQLETIKTSELEEDFVDEIVKSVNAIYSHLPPKYIGSSTMKGTAFVKFLQNIVERLNSSETSAFLSIPSEYDSVIQFVAREAIDESIGRYKEKMSELANGEEKLPMSWDKFNEINNNCTSDARNSFFEKIIGNPKQINDFAEQLLDKISECKEEFKEKNSEALKSHNERIASELWEKYVKVGLTEENLFKAC